ncbi:MAG: hypothetical protein WA947_08485 [Phormidesmis sp.]
MVETNLDRADTDIKSRIDAAEMFIRQGDYSEGIKHALGVDADMKIVINYGGSQHREFDDRTAEPINKLTEAKALDILRSISTPSSAQEASSAQEKLHLRIRVEENGKLVDLVKESRDREVLLNTVQPQQSTEIDRTSERETHVSKDSLQSVESKQSIPDNEQVDHKAASYDLAGVVEKFFSEPIKYAEQDAERAQFTSVEESVKSGEQRKEQPHTPAVEAQATSAEEASSRTNRQPSVDQVLSQKSARQQVIQRLTKIEAALNNAAEAVKNPSPELRWANRNLKQDIETAKQFIAKAKDIDLAVSAQAAKRATDFVSSTVENTGKELAWISKQINKGAEALSKASQNVQKASNWASRGMETFKANSVASSAYKAFQKGSDRVESNVYQIKGYTVSRADTEGEPRYVLSDGDKSIMVFSADDKGVKDINLFNAYDYVQVKAAIRETDVVRSADPKIEQKHERSSQVIANIARKSLEQVNGPAEPGKISTISGKSYSYSQKDGTLTITAKGRGVVLEQTENGEISSKLSRADIARFTPAIEADQKASRSVEVDSRAQAAVR